MSILATMFEPSLRAASYGPAESLDRPGFLVRAIGGGKTNAGVVISEGNALNIPAVYACTNRIANPIAQFPWKIMKPGPAGAGAVEVTDHPMSKIGLRPNDFMSSRTLRKTTMLQALLSGNGYLEIERNGRGQAVGLWPLMWWNTSACREADQLFYRTTINNQQFKLPQDDVIHIMDMSQDGYVGISPIGCAREALGMAKAMETFGGKFFANDAKSGGFLQHPGKLSPVAQKNIGDSKSAPPKSGPAAALEEQGGLSNAHRVKVLEEGMKYISTTIPPEDAQFLGSRGFQIAEIARMYDVPLILLQSTENTTAWGTGIEQLMLGFVRQTIIPWTTAWEQELNWKLFTEEERALGYYVKFNMNSFLRGDTAARMAAYKDMFGMGAINPNGVCALEDIEPVGPDGDTYFISVNYETLKQKVHPPEPPPGTATTETIRETV